ncbi:hypothetical protein CJ030_MR2G004220 [Morella rubra]|uniref:Uncharacterized protein n=1 Tax=Morella rubra TaxID=262757 RepID=A0A6A1WGA6_9ROSI|nr:hypothetical protein CJ030_MR2G004220 [Morella rubra]
MPNSFEYDQSGAVDRIPSLDKKLQKLTPINQEVCIFKLHSELLQINETSYQPCLLAMSLPPWQEWPRSYGISQTEVSEINASKNKGKQCGKTYNDFERIRSKSSGCYTDKVSLTVDEFVEMMLVDECFIAELSCMYAKKIPRNGFDPII